MSLRALAGVMDGVVRATDFRRRLLADFAPPDGVSPFVLRAIDALIEANASADAFADLAHAMRTVAASMHALDCGAIAGKYARVAAELAREAEARR